MSQELPVVFTGTSQARWGPICLVWALPDKRWASQRQSVPPEGNCARSLRGDWALQAGTSLCRRRLGRGKGERRGGECNDLLGSGVRLIFTPMNYETFGKCFKFSEPQSPNLYSQDISSCLQRYCEDERHTSGSVPFT